MIKNVREDLLTKLRSEQLEIEQILDSGLPEKYTTEFFEPKCGVLFQHVLEKYPENGEGVYERRRGDERRTSNVQRLTSK